MITLFGMSNETTTANLLRFATTSAIKGTVSYEHLGSTSQEPADSTRLAFGECFPTATAADWAFVVAAYGATVRAAAKVAA